jgi:hypothetical protein
VIPGIHWLSCFVPDAGPAVGPTQSYRARRATPEQKTRGFTRRSARERPVAGIHACRLAARETSRSSRGIMSLPVVCAWRSKNESLWRWIPVPGERVNRWNARGSRVFGGPKRCVASSKIHMLGLNLPTNAVLTAAALATC